MLHSRFQCRHAGALRDDTKKRLCSRPWKGQFRSNSNLQMTSFRLLQPASSNTPRDPRKVPFSKANCSASIVCHDMLVNFNSNDTEVLPPLENKQMRPFCSWVLRLRVTALIHWLLWLYTPNVRSKINSFMKKKKKTSPCKPVIIDLFGLYVLFFQ